VAVTHPLLETRVDSCSHVERARYSLYDSYEKLFAPFQSLAREAAGWFDRGPTPWSDSPAVHGTAASLELFSRLHLTHARPAFDIHEVVCDDERVPVVEEVADQTPFATLLHFRKECAEPGPRVLVVAPMSGHFATLLRDTVATLLEDHDVYITDWHSARDIPLAAGRFGVEDNVDHLIRFLTAIGPGAHLLAVCQPCVPALAAAALMHEDRDPARPRAVVLMAGPIDTRVNPTPVDDLAMTRPMEWFDDAVLATVPRGLPGAGRRVYPGFVQVGAFLCMNFGRHVRSHLRLAADLANGDAERAERTKAFYDEYFAVSDLPAEFYLETLQWVFQEHRLARGLLEHRGRLVNPAAIKKAWLLTVEGEADDICSVGQTLAAHDLCTGVPVSRKRHHLQPGVGHYGIFSGSRWRAQVYPVVRSVIQVAD
jgi:polyhydroxyalkanoate depolymerase